MRELIIWSDKEASRDVIGEMLGKLVESYPCLAGEGTICVKPVINRLEDGKYVTRFIAYRPSYLKSIMTPEPSP